MRVATGGTVRRGRAVEMTDVGVAPEDVLRAVCGDPAPGLSVECPPPGPVHDYVGHVRPGMAFSLRGALAAAARTRGEEPPQADAVTELRARLVDHSVAGVDSEASQASRQAGGPGDAAAVRRRAAGASDRRRRLREHVATLRGHVEAAREEASDSDATAAAEAELEAAMVDLASVETECVAAEQRLEQVERAARASRDARERRLRAEDRLANLERDARVHLAAAVYDAFATVVDSLPGRADPGDESAAFDGDDVTAALGVARVARLDAPIVLSVRRFDSAAEAAARLDAPVIRV